MIALTGYVVVAAIVLGLIALISWRRWGSKRFPLIVYVIGVAVVWAVILSVMWFSGDIARFQTFALVCLGFALGMLAMYIAVHVYKS
jgi:peptidoglycan/LPS O-acetylase OafA/YrhL